ncbi:hypothetical protein GTA08_BOTSDO01764 [Neofusicoccum parvum]|nr:hypothetical protein GTA08_BOTSDO01764 [Neofusicoccum parvum]
MSTTRVEENELPIHEFIRRQRLRSESISCSRHGISPYPPPKTIHHQSTPSSPSLWVQHRTLFITLLISLSAFHLLFGASLHNLRFRTYARAHTSPPPSRLQFLTSIFPSTFHPPPPPLSPPFVSTTLTDPTTYTNLATASLHHLLTLHAPITAHLQTLSSTRHATYPATLALTHLHTALTSPTQPPDITSLRPTHIQALLTATLLLQNASSHIELHHTLLAPTLAIPPALHTGLRAQAPPKRDQKTNDDARATQLRTARQAAAFGQTLDAVSARATGIAALAGRAAAAAAAVESAMLGACRGAARRTDLACAGALAEVVGPGAAAELEGLGRAGREAGVAAAAVMAGLEGMGDEVGRLRGGVDVWVMFLEAVPGGGGEAECKM